MFDPAQIPNVWRADSLVARGSLVPTGFESLDAALGGGWPTAALIEILTDVYGIGELQLLVPLLQKLGDSAPQPAVILWLNPPHEPNAIALAQHGLASCQHWLVRDLSTKDALWAMELSLRTGACVAVLAWATAVNMAHLRRLKLSVNAASHYAILFRPHAEAIQPSPAHIRLQLNATPCGLQVTVLKAQARKRSELSLDVDRGRLQPKRGRP